MKGLSAIKTGPALLYTHRKHKQQNMRAYIGVKEKNNSESTCNTFPLGYLLKMESDGEVFCVFKTLNTYTFHLIIKPSFIYYKD